VGKRVLLVDDHQLVREALRRALEDADYRVIEADDGDTAVERALTSRPHVVLMDVSMPGQDGIAAARALRTRVPDARVLMLTMHDEDRLVLAARDAGAVGYLLKTASSAEVVDAVARALDGHTVFPELTAPSAPDRTSTAARRGSDGGHRAGAGPAPRRATDPAADPTELSHREQQILQLLADGRTPDEVADALVISPKTVRNHLSRAYDKLGVDNRTQAVLVALQRGYIELP
jgi:two-component system, NarL family, response regulator DegU